MLTDLRMRRLARQWARLHCGLRGAETMAGYQLTATELALACDRARRGQMEPDAFGERHASSLRGDEPGRGRPARPAAAVPVLGPGRHLRHGTAPAAPGRAGGPSPGGPAATAAPPRTTTISVLTTVGTPR